MLDPENAHSQSRDADGSDALERVCKKLELKSRVSPYALRNYTAAPLREEFNFVEFTWLSTGYFPLRKTPDALAPIVGQIKGTTGQKFEGDAHVSHILAPTTKRSREAFKGMVSHTFTHRDRVPKKRHVIIHKGDTLYSYAEGGEGSALVGAINHHDGKFVFFWGGSDKLPDPHNPWEVDWWVKVQGDKKAVGWLRYDPKHLRAELRFMDDLE